ncbi:MAG: LuxR C-terminal-related transcriptional regulator [Rubrivivax sp.]
MSAAEGARHGLPGAPDHATGEAGDAAETAGATLDHRSAFDLAPVGLVISRERLMVDVNRELLAMFGATREMLVGRSFELLYPSAAEFERTGARISASIGAQLDRTGRYSDERVMKRLGPFGGAKAGELFWCRVSGRALDPDQPHAHGIWAFEDLSSRRVLRVEFTPREREIAALLIEGLTSKGIGRRLGVSPRTVDVYRARLMRKTGAATTTELVHKLLAGQG